MDDPGDLHTGKTTHLYAVRSFPFIRLMGISFLSSVSNSSLKCSLAMIFLIAYFLLRALEVRIDLFITRS